MAKMFYTVEEAAAKLGMSPEEVQGLGESGQLQEFRDRDRLMFKRDQVDLLAGDGGDDDEIGDEIRLADSGELEPMSLSSSGSGSAFNDSRAGSGSGDTGVSIFDPDESDADANADTLITGSPGMPDLNDASGSGSGLAQLSLEADDTSLGSDLLSDLGGSGASGTGMAASGSAAPADDGGASGFGTGLGMGDSNAGSLFEGGSAEPEFGAPAAAGAGVGGMVAAEPYDGAWSGIAAGAALGAALLLAVTLGVTILGFAGEGAAELLGGVDSTMIMIVAGGGVVLLGLFAAVGWFLLRKS
ncbi:MAG: helix-turn-helix domain-containing protein [Phycisphaerales bacterium]